MFCNCFWNPQGSKVSYEPFQVLPICGKYQDFLLPTPSDFYAAAFRAMGRLAAWDKLGRFDSLLGASAAYEPDEYLFRSKRLPQRALNKKMNQDVVSKMMDTAIDFIINCVPTIAPRDIQDLGKLQRLKEEMVEMAPYFLDMSGYYQTNDSNFVSAMHVNLQADNAYFWRDEYGDMDCGVLDWGGFQRSPFCMNFLGRMVFSLTFRFVFDGFIKKRIGFPSIPTFPYIVP